VKVRIKEQIKVTAETLEEFEKIKTLARQHLTFADPNDDKGDFGAPKMIGVFSLNKASKSIEFPRGKHGFLEILKNNGLKAARIMDERCEGKDIELNAKFNLRDKIQERAFAAYMKAKWNIGMLNLGCGIGGVKTRA
jgi:hypothetical protein